MSDADLKVGHSLTIPSRVGSVHNTSDTFKPYNPSELIGDTTPTLPVPPADDDGCGFLGQLIMIIVAVVVTVYTAGAFAAASGAVTSTGVTAASVATSVSGTFAAGTAALGGAYGVGTAVAAGIIGGAVGSIASQTVGIAIGAQEDFNWKGVALAAISGGVSGGLAGTSAFAGATFGQTVLRAVIGNAVTQGIGVATGLQKSFNWRGVAAAGVAAGVGYGINQALNYDPSKNFDFGKSVVSGLGSGIASAVVRGGKISIGSIAADAFGNAIAGSFLESMKPPASSAQPAMTFAQDVAARNMARNPLGISTQSTGLGAEPPASTSTTPDLRPTRENAIALGLPVTQIDSTAPISSTPPPPRSVRAGDFGGSLERIARSELGAGASQREINNYVGQLFEINQIKNARGIGPEREIMLPGADTPNATTGLSQYGKDIVIGERIKEQARIDADIKQRQATQQAQSSTSQGMSSYEAYAMYMASGGRSGSYARALGSGYAPTYSAGASYGAAPSMSYDALGNMQGISPEFGGYAGGDASDSYGARVVRAGVGIVETAGAGTYNSVVRIAGGAASAVAFVGSGFDAGAGVAVQEGFKERFGYTPQSAGARDVAQALAPVGAAISSASNSVRAVSESYIGDGATTIVGATLQAGLEIAGVVTGLRGIQRAVGDATFGLPDTSNMLYGSFGGMPIKVNYIAPSLIGDGSALAKAMGGVPEGYQAHHLAMSSIAKDSPALQYLAKQGLYDVNRASNGLALPGNEFLALADDLPLHRGFHGADYRQLVQKEIDGVNIAYRQGASDAVLMQKVNNMETRIQLELLSGNIYLNAADAALRRGK